MAGVHLRMLYGAECPGPRAGGPLGYAPPLARKNEALGCGKFLGRKYLQELWHTLAHDHEVCATTSWVDHPSSTP
eukprot:scaffold5245_cov130-Amphora_coffeaeformis.AAC.1